jgi:hypothetical protein
MHTEFKKGNILQYSHLEGYGERVDSVKIGITKMTVRMVHG